MEDDGGRDELVCAAVLKTAVRLSVCHTSSTLGRPSVGFNDIHHCAAHKHSGRAISSRRVRAHGLFTDCL